VSADGTVRSAAGCVELDMAADGAGLGSFAGATKPGDDMSAGAAGVPLGVPIESVAFCDAGGCASVDCAETNPTVPTIVAATIEAIKVLDAFIVKLLQRHWTKPTCSQLKEP
jgi:hypothetical protein